MSAYEIHYGRRAVVKVNDVIDNSVGDQNDYVGGMKNRIEQIYKKVQENIVTNSKKNREKDEGNNEKITNLKVGDKVLVRNFTRKNELYQTGCRKFQNRFIGCLLYTSPSPRDA